MKLQERKIPLTKPQQRAVKVRGWVKVVAEATRNGKPATEAFWIRVTRVDGDRIEGIVDNDLVLVRGVKHGDRTTASMANVVGILAPEK